MIYNNEIECKINIKISSDGNEIITNHFHKFFRNSVINLVNVENT